MLDSVALERLGIPTVTVVTAIFERPARAQARHAGMPTLPIVVIPDKVDWQTEDEIAEIARNLLPDVVAGLTGSPDTTA